MADSKKFWNRIAENYASQDNPGTDRDFILTLEKTKEYLNSKMKILDFACGPGSAAIALATEVEHVLAIDISDKMIEIAQGRTAQSDAGNIEYKTAEIFDSSLDQYSFDAVTGFNILHLVDDIELTINRIYSLLEEDGLFISLTDSGSKRGILSRFFFRILSKAGIIPYFRQFSGDELNEKIVECGFAIIESIKLYDGSSNCFIVAQKRRGN